MSKLISLFKTLSIFIYNNISNILLLISSVLVLRYVAITQGFDTMTLWIAIMLFITSWSIENNKKGAK